jgi:hypothetical protein
LIVDDKLPVSVVSMAAGGRYLTTGGRTRSVCIVMIGVMMSILCIIAKKIVDPAIEHTCRYE